MKDSFVLFYYKDDIESELCQNYLPIKSNIIKSSLPRLTIDRINIASPSLLTFSI